MIACDDDTCHIQWFHVSCLRIKKVPKGKWFRPDCRKLNITELQQLHNAQQTMTTLSITLSSCVSQHIIELIGSVD